jgi:hypothetical protein
MGLLRETAEERGNWATVMYAQDMHNGGLNAVNAL